MFKLFQGFHMVETYHKEKKERRLSKDWTQGSDRKAPTA